jgi:S-formylglutathione hydrolase FrmB
MLPALLAATALLVAAPPAAPPYEDVTLPSRALGQPVKYRVLLPEGYRDARRRYAVLYLLHGLDGHFDDWTTRTQLARRAGALPIIVVMPEGNSSWYVNAADGSGRYEDYITTELVADVDARFRTIRARYGRAIAGLSMGGYGAVRLALKHPSLYAAAASLSGAFDAPEPAFAERFRAHTEEMGRIFGPAGGEARRDGDVYALADRASAGGAPALFMACGTSDPFLESNRRMAALLQKRGFAYEYHETAGGHGWDYWNRQIDPLLAFIVRNTGR